MEQDSPAGLGTALHAAAQQAIEQAGQRASIGIDVEQTNRWLRPDLRLLRSFSSAEIRATDEVSERRRAELLAGTWCAKEAVVKAFGNVGIRLGIRDVSVVRSELGAPEVHLPDHFQGSNVTVSITHTDGVAAACAVLLLMP